MSDSRQLLLGTDGAMTEPAAPMTSRPPVILQLDLHDFAVLVWVRDEGGAPVYRMAEDRMKAASAAAVLARKLQREASR